MAKPRRPLWRLLLLSLILPLLVACGINSDIASHNDGVANVRIYLDVFEKEAAAVDACVAEVQKLPGVHAAFEDNAATRIREARQRLEPVRAYLADARSQDLRQVPDENAVDDGYRALVQARLEEVDQMEKTASEAFDSILDLCGREYEEYVRSTVHGNGDYGYACRQEGFGETYVADPNGQEWCFYDDPDGGGHYYYRYGGSSGSHTQAFRSCWKCDPAQPVSTTPGYRTNTRTTQFIADDLDYDRAYTGQTVDLRRRGGGGATIRLGTGGSVSSGRGGGK